MKINLKSIKKFFLTYNSEQRREHMLTHFKDLIEIKAPADLSKFKSASLGFKHMLTEGLSDHKFNPFIMLEDDAAKYREFPEYLEVPDDADLLYIGLSSWGLPEGANAGSNHSVDFLDISDEVIRIFNMLSTHGIMVCSKLGADKMYESLEESFHKDVVWDIPVTRKQKEINTYALKTPLVYQLGELGGHELATKIEFRKFKDGNKVVHLLV
jgi:hypothetical protein